MYRTCLCLLAVLGVTCAASLPLRQAYYYNSPSPSASASSSSFGSASTKAALRRIVLGQFQRLQQPTETEYELVYQARPEMQLSPYRQPVYAASAFSLELFVPPNSPTPKNYAMNYLPEGRDVVPGTSYIPLRLLLIRR